MRSRLGLQAQGWAAISLQGAKQNKRPGVESGPATNGTGTYVDLRMVSRERVTWALIGSLVSAAILVLSALISLA